MTAGQSEVEELVERALAGEGEATAIHCQAAAMFLCWPCNMLDLANDDANLPKLVVELAKLLARWEARGAASGEEPDHSWRPDSIDGISLK